MDPAGHCDAVGAAMDGCGVQKGALQRALPGQVAESVLLSVAGGCFI